MSLPKIITDNFSKSNFLLNEYQDDEEIFCPYQNTLFKKYNQLPYIKDDERTLQCLQCPFVKGQHNREPYKNVNFPKIVIMNKELLFPMAINIFFKNEKVKDTIIKTYFRNYKNCHSRCFLSYNDDILLDTFFSKQKSYNNILNLDCKMKLVRLCKGNLEVAHSIIILIDILKIKYKWNDEKIEELIFKIDSFVKNQVYLKFIEKDQDIKYYDYDFILNIYNELFRSNGKLKSFNADQNDQVENLCEEYVNNINKIINISINN